MKKIRFIFPMLFILIFLSVLTNTSTANEEKSRRMILLVNPHAEHLEFLIKMIEEDFIDIQMPIFSVIYDVNRNERFSRMLKFVAEKNLENVRIKKMNEELKKENLFKENHFSELYRELFQRHNGVIFFGGADIPAYLYKEKTSLLTKISTPQRHHFELSFLYHLLGGKQNPDYKALLEDKPEFFVMGFCLGMQSMNVATGGTMYQDIPSDVYGINYAEDVLALEQNKIHRNYNVHLYTAKELDYSSYHQIKFVENKFFTNELEFKSDYQPYVLSIHHQAVKEIGKGFEVTATSLDGKIVEALEHSKYKNVFGVQFHPEAGELYFDDKSCFKYSLDDSCKTSTKEFMEKTDSRRFHLGIWKFLEEVLK